MNENESLDFWIDWFWVDEWNGIDWKGMNGCRFVCFTLLI